MVALSCNRYHCNTTVLWHLRVLSRFLQYFGSTINSHFKHGHTNLEFDNNLSCLQRHKNIKRAYIRQVLFLQIIVNRLSRAAMVDTIIPAVTIRYMICEGNSRVKPIPP